MRQGDGADLLGANDPRSASIGIIYVAPTDDRQSVLAAILTQDKLGRKQVAVVLPETNRAFQRPVDFDGLKNMRRGLKTEIVFVAPGGPGPAEFARQRRFTVFTSLESFASSLRAEPSGGGGAKKGLFGRKQKPAPANARPVPTTDVIDMRRPLPIPLPGAMPTTASTQSAAEPDDDEDRKTEEKHAGAAPLIGLAGVAGAAAIGASLADNEDDLLPPPAAPSSAQSTNNPSPTAYPTPADGGVKPTGATRAAGGPDIIAFSTPAPRPRTTAKLPAAAPAAQRGASSPNPNATPPTRNGNTGKRAVVLAGAAGLGAGLGAAATAGRTPSAGGGQPPVRGNTGGGGGGGGRPRRRRTRRLLALLLILLTLLLLVGIAFASPGGQGLISHLGGGPTTMAIVTITPKNKTVSNSIEIRAVTGKPDPQAQEVQARVLTYTSSPPQSATARATGSIPGQQATGTLIFINTGGGPVPIQGQTLTGKDGVQVFFSGTFTVPIGSISVLGTAVNADARGNIPALDIFQNCCGSNIAVRNPAPFSGGIDPIPNSVIQQADITSATNALIDSLKPTAQAQLQGQVKKNEQVVANSLNCTSNMTANHRVGDQARSVTVTGTVTCTEEVFDLQGAFALASKALMMDAAKDPGAGYVLVGNIVEGLGQPPPMVGSKQTVTLVVQAMGVWEYDFTTKIEGQLAAAITMKTKKDALVILQAATGVSSVTLNISSGDMVPDVAHIMFVIKHAVGVTGSPTTTPGSPTSGTTPTSTTGSPTSGTTPTSVPALTPSTGLGGS